MAKATAKPPIVGTAGDLSPKSSPLHEMLYTPPEEKVKFEFTRRVNELLTTTIEERTIEEVRQNLDRRAMERDDVFAFEELTYADGRVCFTLRNKYNKNISQWRQI